MTTTQHERVPQVERSRTMRERLMEAAVELLVDVGWSGTTTTQVSQRAGVSRGAQLHHFPSKQDLLVAAVEHLGERLIEEFTALASVAQTLPAQTVATSGERAAAETETEADPQADPRTGPAGPERTRSALRALAQIYVSPLFVASLELWVAARTDEQLHAVVAPLERRWGREAHKLAVQLLGVDDRDPATHVLVEGTLDMMRGLGLANTLSDDGARRGRLLDAWAEVLDRGCRRPVAGPSPSP